MEPLDGLEILARAARRETAPITRVPIASIVRAARGQRPLRLAPLAWSAGLSALAASVVVVFALHQNTSSSSVDSISPLFNTAQVQLP
jgi:hypothetical protein